MIERTLLERTVESNSKSNKFQVQKVEDDKLSFTTSAKK